MKVKDMDGFQKIIAEWCSDDDGKNILYKKIMMKDILISNYIK